MPRLSFLVFALLLSCCEPLLAGDEMARAVWAEINLARQQPHRYAGFVRDQRETAATREAVRFLEKARSLPPLRWSPAMSASASSHVFAQGRRGSMGHRGVDGSSPWQRLKRFGEWGGQVGENIHYGEKSARQIVIDLIVDAGVPTRGHRKNIFNGNFAVAGISHGGHARFGSVCVIDFAGTFVPLGAVGRSISHRTAWSVEDPIFRRR